MKQAHAMRVLPLWLVALCTIFSVARALTASIAPGRLTPLGADAPVSQGTFLWVDFSVTAASLAPKGATFGLNCIETNGFQHFSQCHVSTDLNPSLYSSTETVGFGTSVTGTFVSATTPTTQSPWVLTCYVQIAHASPASPSCTLRWNTEPAALISWSPGSPSVLAPVLVAPRLQLSNDFRPNLQLPVRFHLSGRLSATFSPVDSVVLLLQVTEQASYSKDAQVAAGDCYIQVAIGAQLSSKLMRVSSDASGVIYTSNAFDSGALTGISQDWPLLFDCPATWTSTVIATLTLTVNLGTTTHTVLPSASFAPSLFTTAGVAVLTTSAVYLKEVAAGGRITSDKDPDVTLGVFDYDNMRATGSTRLRFMTGDSVTTGMPISVYSLIAFGPYTMPASGSWRFSANRLFTAGDRVHNDPISIIACIEGLPEGAYNQSAHPGFSAGTVCAPFGTDSDRTSSRHALPTPSNIFTFRFSRGTALPWVSNTKLTTLSMLAPASTPRTFGAVLPRFFSLGISSNGAQTVYAAPRPRYFHAQTASTARLPMAEQQPYANTGQHVFWFGGTPLHNAGDVHGVLNDLWMHDVLANSWTLLSGDPARDDAPARTRTGAQPTQTSAGLFDVMLHPAGRNGAALSYDWAQQRLWLFGGTTMSIEGFDSSPSANFFDDLWAFDLRTRRWAWFSGSVMAQGANVLLSPDTPPGLVGASLVVTPHSFVLLFGGFCRQITPSDGSTAANTLTVFESSALYSLSLTAPTVAWTKIGGTAQSTTLTHIPETAAGWPGGRAFHGVAWSNGDGSSTFGLSAPGFYIYGGMLLPRRTVTTPCNHLSADSDSAVLGSVWFAVASATGISGWIKAAADGGIATPEMRGVPRSTMALGSPTGAPAFHSPGGRVMPALAAGPQGLYLFGGRGHSLSLALPADPRSTTDVIAFDDLPPVTPLRTTPPLVLNLSHILHHAFVYTAQELQAAGAVAGMALRDLDVMLQGHPNSSLAPNDSTFFTIATSLQVISDGMADFATFGVKATRDYLVQLAEMTPGPSASPLSFLRSLTRGSFVGVTQRMAPRPPTPLDDKPGAPWIENVLWDGTSPLLLYMRVSFPNPIDSMGEFGVSMRTTSTTRGAVIFGQTTLDPRLYELTTGMAVPVIILRSHLPPRLAQMPASALSPYAQAQLDDLWLWSPATATWTILTGSYGPTRPAYTPSASPSTRAAGSGQGPGGRVGASLVLMREPIASANGELTYLVLVGGSAVFTSEVDDAERARATNLHSPYSDVRSWCSYAFCGLYDDAWSFLLPPVPIGGSTATCLDSVSSLSTACSSDLGQARLTSLAPLIPFATDEEISYVFRGNLTQGTPLAMGGICEPTVYCSSSASVCHVAPNYRYCTCSPYTVGASCSRAPDLATNLFALKYGYAFDVETVQTLVNQPVATAFAAHAFVPALNRLYMYGGLRDTGTTTFSRSRVLHFYFTGGVSKLELAGQQAFEGSCSSVSPPATSDAAMWLDVGGEYLYLVAASDVADLGVWRAHVADGADSVSWTLVGPDIFSHPFTYPDGPTKNTDASGLPFPGARDGSAKATRRGEMCLYSGTALLVPSKGLKFNNDIWCFRSDTHAWRKVIGVSGTSAVIAPVWGPRAAFDATYTPGSRFGASMTFSDDGLYLFLYGGQLVPAFGSVDGSKQLMGDLWAFRFEDNLWAWLGGEIEPSSPSVQRPILSNTVGSPSRLSYPGSRMFASLVSSQGMLYLAYGLSEVPGEGHSTIFSTHAASLLGVSPPPADLEYQHTEGMEIAWAPASLQGIDETVADLGRIVTAPERRQAGATLMVLSPLPTDKTFTGKALYLANGITVSGYLSTYPFFRTSFSNSRTRIVKLTSACHGAPCGPNGFCDNGLSSVGTGSHSRSHACTCASGFTGKGCEVNMKDVYGCNGAGPDAGTPAPTPSLLNPCTCGFGTVQPLCHLPAYQLEDYLAPNDSTQRGALHSASASVSALDLPTAIALGARVGDPAIFYSGGLTGSTMTMFGAIGSVFVWLPLQRRMLPILDAIGRTHLSQESGAAQSIGGHYGHSMSYSPSQRALFIFGGHYVNDTHLTRQERLIKVPAERESPSRKPTMLNRPPVVGGQRITLLSTSNVVSLVDGEYEHTYPTALVHGYPGARAFHSSAIAVIGGVEYLYVYGGFGLPANTTVTTPGYLSDLWRIRTDVVALTDTAWEYVGCAVNRADRPGPASADSSLAIRKSGTTTLGCPPARARASLTFSRGLFWLVGGVRGQGPLNDYWSLDPVSLVWRVYQRQSQPNTNPFVPMMHFAPTPTTLGSLYGTACTPGVGSDAALYCYGGIISARPIIDFYDAADPITLTPAQLSYADDLANIAAPFTVPAGTMSSWLHVRIPKEYLAATTLHATERIRAVAFRLLTDTSSISVDITADIAIREIREVTDTYRSVLNEQATAGVIGIRLGGTLVDGIAVFPLLMAWPTNDVLISVRFKEAFTSGGSLAFQSEMFTAAPVSATKTSYSTFEWNNGSSFPAVITTGDTFSPSSRVYTLSQAPYLRLLRHDPGKVGVVAATHRIFRIATMDGSFSQVVGPPASTEPSLYLDVTLAQPSQLPPGSGSSTPQSAAIYARLRGSHTLTQGLALEPGAGTYRVFSALRPLPAATDAGFVLLPSSRNGALFQAASFGGAYFTGLLDLERPFVLPHAQDQAVPIPVSSSADPWILLTSDAARSLGVLPEFVPPPEPLAIAAASFLNSAVGVTIVFSRATQRPTVTPDASWRNCASVLDASGLTQFGEDLERQIGVGAQCAWTEPTTFRILLGTDFELRYSSPNNQITVRSSFVYSADGQTALFFGANTASVSAPPTAFPVPVAVISGPSLASVCADLTFSSTLSTFSGGLAFQYSWSLVPGTNTSEAEAVSKWISDNTPVLDISRPFKSSSSPRYIPTLRIPRASISNLFASPGERLIQLSVTAWHGAEATTSFSFTVRDAPVPALSIAGPRALSVSRARNVLVNAVIAPAELCEGSFTQSVKYAWALTNPPSGPKVLFEGSQSSLRIRAFDMPATPVGSPLVFSVVVTATVYSAGGTTNLTTSDTVSIAVTAPPLRAVIDGGDTVHGAAAQLVLSGARSLDQNVEPAKGNVTAGLGYQWACATVGGDVIPDGSACSAPVAEDWQRDTLTLSPTYLKDLRMAFVGSNDTAPLTLSFTLTLSKTGRPTETAVTRVMLVSSITHSVVIDALPAAKAVPAQPLALTAFIAPLATGGGGFLAAPVVVWSCDSRNADLTSAAVAMPYAAAPALVDAATGRLEHRLVLTAAALIPGAHFIFRASLFAANATIPLPEQISLAPPGPLAGEMASAFVRFEVNAPPLSGVCGLAGGATVATEGVSVSLACFNWADDDEDLPLTYQWLLLTRRKRGLSYQEIWVEVGIALPRPTLELTVERGPDAADGGARRVAVVIKDIHGAQTTSFIMIRFADPPLPSQALLAAASVLQSPSASRPTSAYYALAGGFRPLAVVAAALEARLAEMDDAALFSDVRVITQTALRVADTLEAALPTAPPGFDRDYRARLFGKIRDMSATLALSQDARRAVAAVDAAAGGAPSSGTALPPEESMNQFLRLRDNSEVAIELLTQICGDPDVDGGGLNATLRHDVLTFLVSQAAPLAASDRFAGVSARTAEASLAVLDSISASFAAQIASVHPNSTLGASSGSSEAGSAEDLEAGAAAAALLAAESHRLANLIAVQVNVAAMGALGSQALGGGSSIVRAGAFSVASQPVSTHALPPLMASELSTGASATMRLPPALSGLPEQTLQLVMAVVEDASVLHFAGLAPGALLNASDSSPLVAFTVFDRASTEATDEPVGSGGGSVSTVKAPKSLTVNLAELEAPGEEFFELEIPHAAPTWPDVTFTCEWWKAGADGDGGAWSTEGCILAATSDTNTTTTCKCTHLTMFRVRMSFNNVVPRFNTLSASDFLNLTWSNIKEHPVPIISCLVWFVAYLIFAAIATAIDRRKDARALRQYHGEWLEPQVAQFDALTGAHPHAEDSAVSPRSRGYKPKHNGRGEYHPDATFTDRWIDFMWYSMRHDHMWLSVPKRDDTHAFSSVGRLTAAFVLVLTGYMINAMFFGNSGGDVGLSSILISVISAAILIPVGFFISALFGRSQRGRLKSAIYGYAEHVTYLRWTGRDQEPEFATRLEHRLKINPVVPDGDVGYILSQIARSAGWTHGPGNVPVPSDQRGTRDEVELRKQLRLLVHVDHDLFMVWYRAQWSFPSGLRLFGFVVLWMWVLACVMLILVYGMQFDLVSDGNTLTWLRASAISNALEIFAFKPATIAAKTFFLTLLSLLCCGAGDLCNLTSQRTSDDNLTVVESCEIYRYTGGDGATSTGAGSGQAALDLQFETGDPESPYGGQSLNASRGFRFAPGGLDAGASIVGTALLHTHSSAGAGNPSTEVEMADLGSPAAVGSAGAMSDPLRTRPSIARVPSTPTSPLAPVVTGTSVLVVPTAYAGQRTPTLLASTMVDGSGSGGNPGTSLSSSPAPMTGPVFTSSGAYDDSRDLSFAVGVPGGFDASPYFPASAVGASPHAFAPPPPPPQAPRVSALSPPPPPQAVPRTTAPLSLSALAAASAVTPAAPAAASEVEDDDDYDPSRPPRVPAAPVPTGGVAIMATNIVLGAVVEGATRGASNSLYAPANPLPVPKKSA